MGSRLRGKFGNYVLSSLIGEGGMSQIWLAKQESAHYERKDLSEVAIKIPKDQPVAIDKMSFEIDILQKIKHPHIVAFIDSGFIETFSFLVMEYLGGRNLEKLIAGNPLDEDDAKKIVVQTLLALDRIHSDNIIHRDVKPKNLIIQEDQFQIKLIDFGTCAYFNRTGIPEAVISPGGYTAPEQYSFMSSPQTDIWSVGGTFFFLLTAQPPAIALPGYPNLKPPSPPDVRKFNHDVSDETSSIIMKAMSWDPTERYFSAKEMIEAIERHTELPKEVSNVPVIEVMGEKIRIETPILRFGRIEGSYTDTSMNRAILSEGGKIRVLRSGDITEVQVRDPYNWISRKHFEIFRQGDRWFIKDSGSLNRTSVRTQGKVKEIWVGYKVEGPPLELGDKALIHVAYGSSLNAPPYLVVTFRK
jgi:serine/threonine protein kinase